ncbi:anaphase-promoting complex, cyclosome, subunit 4-domain-containing protein [Podospora appendiculata]|uniref:Anaphase-promoting complex subunit 4 n=1 Tax=Podospora appendiculata TaxID=314037 RepID=A0AAE0XF51_9PEZI|nr:anaphase-promoting complex, cyclosome, subunit 4-domain-containing protein [Podospora appendiculata]
MVQNDELPLFSTSTLSVPVSGGHLACNPVIDLAAAVGDENVLYIWRANDQLVSKHTERGQKVDAIKWKEDGLFLAAGWSDGVVRLVGLESSKPVHHIRVGNGESSKINFIAWSRNATGDRRAATWSSTSRLPSRTIDLDETRDILDLPHELTFLEIETALPKISPLPVSGGSGDDMFVFSTTTSLDFVFRPCKVDDADTVHVMIVGTTDGGIHLSIYDSFVIGTFKHSPDNQGVFQLCGHGSHPEASTHFLLLRSKEDHKAPGEEDDVDNSLYLVPMDLTFVHDSPVNLSLLASKMTTLQNLLRYVKQTQAHMTNEWKSTRELPARFLLGVQEDLQKMPTGPMTIVQAMYHTVATGHVFPPVKEWLVDSLAERGHKRWDKAVASGLQNLRSLVHENFIPALERCGIILSRLLGIAHFHDSRESIGFTAAQISRLMDIVVCLTVVANNVLLTVMDELDHFTAFSAWLRLEIDKLASSTMSDELTEKEVTMDNGKVLSYIQQYLLSSPLALYFDEVTKEDYSKDLDLAEDGSSLLEMLEKQLKRQESGLTYMKALPHIDFLVTYLTSRANTVFHDIAEAEKRNVRFGQSTEVSIGEKIWRHDLHVVLSTENDAVRTFTAIVPESDKSKVYLFRTLAHITNGISAVASTEVLGLELPKGITIIDFKFLDDLNLLILCHHNDDAGPVLLKLVYRAHTMVYRDYTIGKAPRTEKLGTSRTGSAFSTFRFSDMAGFTPVQMDVQRGSKAKGEMPARVCLLGRDKTVYRTYALPADWEITAEGLVREDHAAEEGGYHRL